MYSGSVAITGAGLRQYRHGVHQGSVAHHSVDDTDGDVYMGGNQMFELFQAVMIAVVLAMMVVAMMLLAAVPVWLVISIICGEWFLLEE